MKTHFAYVSILMVMFFSCKKKATENPETITDPTTGTKVKYGSIKMDFQHVVGSEALGFFTDYVNSSAETFQITTLKYYVSNIKLTKPDKSVISIPNTYFLIDVSQANKLNGTYSISVPNVPEGNYNGVSFLIGVDSAQTEAGAKTGDLAAEKGMLWIWEGYMAIKFEGNSPISTTSGNYFSYQIFGYKGEYNALQTIPISFGENLLMVKQNAVPTIHLSVDILEFFRNPNNLSIAKNPKTQTHADSLNKAISTNYVDMFRFEHVHN